MYYHQKSENIFLPEPGYDGDNSYLNLNYLLLGYHLSAKPGSIFKKLTVFLHATNLLASKAFRDKYSYSKYAGVGANLVF